MSIRHLVQEMNEMNNEKRLAQSESLTPVVLHGFQEEHRDFYMKGYIESANTLLKICEAVFAGSPGIQYVRERFAARITEEAELMDEIKTLYK